MCVCVCGGGGEFLNHKIFCFASDRALELKERGYPLRRNVTTLMVGLKKTVTYAKISPKVVNPRDIPGGTQKKKKKKRERGSGIVQLVVH